MVQIQVVAMLLVEFIKCKGITGSCPYINLN
jgi:hypothetical protein